MLFFFFKQKTAYEMRISDWSSDVCSSDLRLRASITGQTSQIAVDLAANKDLTKALLAEAGLPVPRGIVVRSADEAAAFAERVGFPLVTKPLDGNHGRGVSTALLNEAQVREGFEIAIKHSRRVVVERHLSGHDHRSEEHTSELQSLMR